MTHCFMILNITVRIISTSVSCTPTQVDYTPGAGPVGWWVVHPGEMTL